MKVLYRAFGIRISSTIPLPELPLDHSINDNVDVTVDTGDLASLWNEMVTGEDNFVAREDTFIFKIADTATFCIQGGSRIVVSSIPGADADKIRLFVLGTCMGVILMQRRVLPLHGSAIVIDGRAYAIIGESGAGKSTLAAAFLHRGCQLLTDDVIAVSIDPDSGQPMVHPAYPQQKLWQESIDRLGLQSDGFRPIFERETKYAVPVASEFSQEAIPLAGVFELVKSQDEEVALHKFSRLEQLHVFMKHTYRSSLIPQLGLEQWLFSFVTSMASQVDTYRLTRPINGFTAQDLAVQIGQIADKGVCVS
ncbi:aldolase [Paenibacillus sedimenti]|uniref:Aldolase n=1 Tax=Paenibacillus sedimenti TaxID=2770274 RepID=A0A926KLZ4_9BACL|nr:aldolase [Paenibacillus sedimenti]MBD0379747.1 aldolase [Paenibacillus sedimenti]